MAAVQKQLCSGQQGLSAQKGVLNERHMACDASRREFQLKGMVCDVRRQ